MKAILFVGHGSRDPEGNHEVRQFIENYRKQSAHTILIETCFLEFENPTVGEGIQLCADKGCDHIIIIPIMLLQAGHSKIHIPAAIDEAKEKYPAIQFTYGKPIGVHEEAFEILKTRLTEINEDWNHTSENTAVLLLGRGGSDPDANSDLYKISRLLWEKTEYPIVEPAFMGVTNPLVDEGISRCVQLGAKKVIILPYFLFTGILIKRLEEMMLELPDKYPGVEFKLAGYFGYHPKLQVILNDRVEEALQNQVKMNCDSCQYRLDAMAHVHHHHHEHDHDHHHHGHDHDHHHHGHESHQLRGEKAGNI